MNKILLLFLVSLYQISASGQDSFIKEVNSIELQQTIQGKNGILMDVRTRSEFSNGHIEQAGNLNYYAFDFKRKLTLLPKDQPIYLYCTTGYRSKKAAEILVKNGYTNVYNLQHGIMEWELQNLPVIMEPDARPDIENKMETRQFYEAIGVDSLVFVDFYAPWCGPCRKMMPMIDSLMVEYHPDIRIMKVNVDASKRLVKKLQIVGVPYLALYKNGEILFSKSGAANRTELTGIFDLNIEN